MLGLREYLIVAVRVARRAFDGVGTWIPDADGTWMRKPVAARFALLDAVSQIGSPSPALSTQWRQTRQTLVALIDAGLICE